MTSMDKRKGSYLGAPKHKKRVAVVMAKTLENSDVTLEGVFSNCAKAQAHVDSQVVADSGSVQRWVERWLIQ